MFVFVRSLFRTRTAGQDASPAHYRCGIPRLSRRTRRPRRFLRAKGLSPPSSLVLTDHAIALVQLPRTNSRPLHQVRLQDHLVPNSESHSPHRIPLSICPAVDRSSETHPSCSLTITPHSPAALSQCAFACATAPLHSLDRLLLGALWVWIHQFMCNVSNQTRGAAEDAVNKPWRIDGVCWDCGVT